jgi:hypothetical protein
MHVTGADWPDKTFSAFYSNRERPRPSVNRDAGIDLSPAVRDYLGMSGMDQCDWKFVEAKEIPQGPWKYRDNSRLWARLSVK